MSIADLRSAHSPDPGKPRYALCGIRMPPVAVPGSPPCIRCLQSPAQARKLTVEPRQHIVDFVVERPSRLAWPADARWPKLTTRKARPGKGYPTVERARQAVRNGLASVGLNMPPPALRLVQRTFTRDTSNNWRWVCAETEVPL